MEQRAVTPLRAVAILSLLVAWAAAHFSLWGPYGPFLLPFEFTLAIFALLAITIGRSWCRHRRSAT